MPNISDLSSKAFNVLTPITFTAIQGSSGDGQEAVWQNLSAGNSSAVRSTIRYSVQSNGARNARRMKVRFSAPQTYVETTTGLTKVANTIVGELSLTVPSSVPQSFARDSVAGFLHALGVEAGSLTEAISDGLALT